MAIGRRWLVLLLVPVLVLFSYCGLGDALPTGLTAPSDEHLRGYTSRLDRLEAEIVHIKAADRKGMELQGRSNRLQQLRALLEIQRDYKDYRPIPDLIEDKIPRVHESCQEAYNDGWMNSGIYTIMPNGSTKYHVYCQFGEHTRDFRPSATMNLAKVFGNCTDAYEHGWMQSGLYTIRKDSTETIDVVCEQEQYLGNRTVFTSCADAYQRGYKHSGLYNISISYTQTHVVYCEQEQYGGGWEVFPQRMDGSVDFFRGWNEYRNGFGNINPRGEYWLGLEAIHQLTKNQTKKLKVELTFPNGRVYRMDYSTFWLEGSSQSYKLHVGGYTGPSHVGDRLDYQNLQQFTTKDHDRDKHIGNCAVGHHGAWWYKSCSGSNLNGGYGVSDCKGFTWDDINPLSGSRMMMKLI